MNKNQKSDFLRIHHYSWNDDRGEADGVYLDDHSYKWGDKMINTKRQPVSAGEMLIEEFTPTLQKPEGFRVKASEGES